MMKSSSRRIRTGTVLLVVLGCAPFALAWLRIPPADDPGAVQPKQRTTSARTTSPDVTYSRSPKRPPHLPSPRTTARVTPPQGRRVMVPKPLTQEAYTAALARVRVLAGIPVDAPQEAPSQVRLAPDWPRSGNNSFELWMGDIMRSGGMSSPFRAEMDYPSSAIFLTFETVPGKTYLLDIRIAGGYSGVGDYLNWYTTEGAVNSEMVASNEAGHLLLAFTADSASEALWLRPYPHYEGAGDFYEAVLTRVD